MSESRKNGIKKIPCVVLRDLSILPNVIMHFDISEEISIKGVAKAMASSQEILVTTTYDPDKTDISNEDINRIGTLVNVKQVIKMPNHISRVMVEGLHRAEIVKFLPSKDHRLVSARVYTKAR